MYNPDQKYSPAVKCKLSECSVLNKCPENLEIAQNFSWKSWRFVELDL